MEKIIKFFRVISRIVLPRIITIGIDIEERRLAAVATMRRGDADEIVASALYALPEGTVKKGELCDQTAIEDAIGMFLKKMPKKRFIAESEYAFVLSVPPNHLYAETISFPQMDEAELPSAVRLKLETSLPWRREQAYVDWNIVSGEEERTTVFVAAIARTVLDEYLKPFLRSGWRLSACEFHMLSLSKFMSREEISSFIFALIDDDGIEFSVFHSGRMLVHYLQTVPKPEDAQKVLEDKTNQLIDYVGGNFGIKAERIFVFDTLNKEYALANIQNRTGVVAQSFTPPPHLDPRLFIAIGASRRTYSPLDSEINLMPPELGGRYQHNLFSKTLTLWANIFLIFSMLFLIIFGSISVFLNQVQKGLATEIATLSGILKEQIVQSQPLAARAEYFNSLTQNVRGTVALRSARWKIMGGVVVHAKSAGVAIGSIRQLSEKELYITATAPTREAAVLFKKFLDKDEVFASASLPLTQLGPEKDLSLSINLRIQ